MRIILDTNVLISALISLNSPPDRIYKAWQAGQFNLVTSELQLDELLGTALGQVLPFAPDTFYPP